MKLNKKILFFVALMCLFSCISLIQDTFAKYVTSTNADSNFTIARWSISINNEDITNESDFSELIVPVFEGTQNIKENIVAPTSEGYFDIVIDGAGTDVSYTYSVKIESTEENTVSDLIIYEYTQDETNYNFVMGSEISGDVLYDVEDSEKLDTIRFKVKWNDDNNETMNNKLDTEASKSGTAAFKVTVSVTQKI